jgi:predicted nucleic acid-binding protein
VVSELSRSSPERRVIEWLSQHAGNAALAAVTLGEVTYGVESLPVGARRNALARWCGDLRIQFAARILTTDEAVWCTYGRLKASLEGIGRPQDEVDLLIGATATVHGLRLVTRNERHFRHMGVLLLNPWNIEPETT